MEAWWYPFVLENTSTRGFFFIAVKERDAIITRGSNAKRIMRFISISLECYG
jgi:hypothetical protein